MFSVFTLHLALSLLAFGGITFASELNSGNATYYNLRMGQGITACGDSFQNTDFVAAVSFVLFDREPGSKPDDTNNNPICKKKAYATYKDKSVIVAIKDRCASCPDEWHLDLSPSAFEVFEPQTVGLFVLKWGIIADDLPLGVYNGAAPKLISDQSGDGDEHNGGNPKEIPKDDKGPEGSNKGPLGDNENPPKNDNESHNDNRERDDGSGDNNGESGGEGPIQPRSQGSSSTSPNPRAAFPRRVTTRAVSPSHKFAKRNMLLKRDIHTADSSDAPKRRMERRKVSRSPILVRRSSKSVADWNMD